MAARYTASGPPARTRESSGGTAPAWTSRVLGAWVSARAAKAAAACSCSSLVRVRVRVRVRGRVRVRARVSVRIRARLHRLGG